ncbi:hypothetical protein SAMN05421869_104107 [Nonomuraea jiangxiensis]|uniref:Lipoprotein n=2 Tax=Nonomuraea jiangxiensis TaxID=633440 RepID=A0A1G8HA72_9ACTN|nr:hypothetical protein SAMN05421869_104107 [Nonomuraea jiangxiensis]
MLLFAVAMMVVSCSSTAPAGSPPKPVRVSQATVARPPTAVAETPPGLRALPPSGVGPATYAYTCGSEAAGETAGACGHWRLLTRDGGVWYLPEALGDYETDDESGTAPLAISPDGLRIAYYRASDGRLVVRELATGATTPMQHAFTWDIAGSTDTAAMEFLGKGTWLMIYNLPPDEEGAVLAAVATGETREVPGNVIDVDATGSRLTTETAADTGVRLQTTGGPVHHITVTGLHDQRALGGFIAQDGLAFDLVPRNIPACGNDISPDKLVTVDLTTGKTISVVTPRLPADVLRGWGIGWLSPREVLVSVVRKRSQDTTVENTFALDIMTGGARQTGRIDKAGLRVRDPGLVPYGSAVYGGYLAAPPYKATPEKVVPIKHRGCE